MNPIPIIEYSVCNALGRTRGEVLERLRSGESGLAKCTYPLDFETYTGAIPGEFPPLPAALGAWDSRALRITYHLLQSMEPAWRAMMQRWAPERVGVFIGTSTAGIDQTEHAFQTMVQTGKLPKGYDLWKHHAYGAVLDLIEKLTGAKGPAWVVSTACTSSAKTFATAARLIETGQIDAAIVGGVDTLCSMTLQGFHSLSALSTERTRPFSGERQGINIGEGGALMLLERDADAAHYLIGVGESSDAYHIAAPHPEGTGAQLAMTRALESANLAADAVDFINAHGTGTRLNDAMESRAIHAVFPNRPPVLSTKGWTGHALGGAGATEIALCLLSLEHGFLPASIGAVPVDQNLPVHVMKERKEGRFTIALSNSFAFGGNNISVVLQHKDKLHA